MKVVVMMVMCLVMGAVAFAQPNALKTIKLTVDERERNALIYVPENARKVKGKRPLVIVIHGESGTARGVLSLTNFRFHSLANHDNVYVLYPNAHRKMWEFGDKYKENKPKDKLKKTSKGGSKNESKNGSKKEPKKGKDDAAYFDALLEEIEKNYPVDMNKLFVTGISQGGMMSYFLACRFPEKVRALAPVAMSLPKAFQELCKGAKNLPFLLMNGDADPVVPYRGGKVKFLGRKYGTVLSTKKTIDFWRKLNGCTKEVKSESLNRALNDGTGVKRSIWRKKCHHAPVVLYRIEKGGHSWPGGRQYLPKALIGNVSREIDATTEIWRFFRLFFQ